MTSKTDILREQLRIEEEKEIDTILRSNIMGGYHDRRWSGLQEKMFPWTNDFPDVKCTDPNCTQSHLGI
jgi:hypothetical protein